MSDELNLSLGGLRKKVDLSKIKEGIRAEQFDLGKNDKLKSVFNKLDADGDGVVTADEIKNYIKLLQDAAGADNKLNRKEAKNSGLGSRKDINSILKQAIEISENMKPERKPSEPSVESPQVKPETAPQQEPTVVVVVDETEETSDDDDDTDTVHDSDEPTTQSALKALFGDKKKASVKIDGAATGLGKAYQGEIRLANDAKLEDGKFPQTMRMTLPASYGQNATMKLTLVDEENGIYETSAHDRHFQIKADENGNISLESVDVDELSGKLNANLAEYARIAEEKAAAEAEAETPEGAAVELTPEQIASAKKKQMEAHNIASGLYNTCTDKASRKVDQVSGKEFQSYLKKINSENASAVLSNYNKEHPDESFVRLICNEKTSNDGNRKAALKYVMSQLAAEAKAKGVPQAEVDKLVKEFNASADKEFDGWFNVINSTVMDNTMKQLLGLTQGAELDAGEVSAADAKDSITGAANQEYNTAKTSFDSAREEEGWFAKRGDEICGLFGCTTKGDMETKLGKYKGDIEKLQNCKTEAEFKTAYKEVFGIEYDGKKVAAYQAAYSDYAMAYSAKENMDNMRQLANDARGLDYDAYKSKVMASLNMSAEEVDALVDGLSADYIKQNPHSGKVDVLRNWVNTQADQSREQFDQIAKGRSLEQIGQDVDSIRQAAFGTNDIVSDVMKYNANQQITGMVTEAAAEILVTVALSAVPGGQAFAAARLAANAAKWGSRGIKIARYMPKAANLVSKAATGVKNTKAVQAATRGASAVKNSKVVQRATNAAEKVADVVPTNVKGSTARIVRGADAAFEGTFAVNIADGKSVKDSVERALTNAAFGAAGATSAELAPYLAKALGCSSKVATEICERTLDVASTAGISYGVTGGYTSNDAFRDTMVGVIMGRIGKGFKGKAPKTETHSAPKPSVLDRATANNTAVPGGSLGKKKFDQVKQEVKEELNQGVTPQRAAEIHNEADKLQVQDRAQGREIKHIVEDATGVYDSPTLGKIDLANETDLSKLQQAKKEISQWFDGKKDVRGDAARDKQALLDKIEARMTELKAKPELQKQPVKSEVVDEMNTNTVKDAEGVLANTGKPLSSHGAAILDDRIKITDSIEELETMRKQLESRVGYQVQGVDQAAETIKKINAKIGNIKAHQADFAQTIGKVDNAISAGKGLSADDLNTIRAFAEKCNSADELKQLVDKMRSSKAIKSYSGSKKLIAEMEQKMETLKAKAAAQSKAAVKPDEVAPPPPKAETPEAEAPTFEVKPEGPAETPRMHENYVDPHHIELSDSPRPALDAEPVKPVAAEPEVVVPKAEVETPKGEVPVVEAKPVDVPEAVVKPETPETPHVQAEAAAPKNNFTVSSMNGQHLNNVKSDLKQKGIKFEEKTSGGLQELKFTQDGKQYSLVFNNKGTPVSCDVFQEGRKIMTQFDKNGQITAEHVFMSDGDPRHVQIEMQRTDFNADGSKVVKDFVTRKTTTFDKNGNVLSEKVEPKVKEKPVEEKPETPEEAARRNADLQQQRERVIDDLEQRIKYLKEYGGDPKLITRHEKRIAQLQEEYKAESGHEYVSKMSNEVKADAPAGSSKVNENAALPSPKPEVLDNQILKYAESTDITGFKNAVNDHNLTLDSNQLAGGNGHVVFTQNGNKYQMHYENGQLSAMRIKDADGNKFYFDYNSGHRKAISRDEFIDLKESSDLKLKQVINDVSEGVKDRKLTFGEKAYVSGNAKIQIGDNTVLDLSNPEVKAYLDSMKENSYVIVGRESGVPQFRMGTGTTSREHATIRKVGDNLYEIKDTSRNGTIVNPKIADSSTPVKPAETPSASGVKKGFQKFKNKVKSAFSGGLTTEHKVTMNYVTGEMYKAKTPKDFEKLQKMLDNVPDCTQKTHLQRQLAERQKECLGGGVTNLNKSSLRSQNPELVNDNIALQQYDEIAQNELLLNEMLLDDVHGAGRVDILDDGFANYDVSVDADLAYNVKFNDGKQVTIIAQNALSKDEVVNLAKKLTPEQINAGTININNAAQSKIKDVRVPKNEHMQAFMKTFKLDDQVRSRMLDLDSMVEDIKNPVIKDYITKKLDTYTAAKKVNFQQLEELEMLADAINEYSGKSVHYRDVRMDNGQAIKLSDKAKFQKYLQGENSDIDAVMSSDVLPASIQRTAGRVSVKGDLAMEDKISSLRSYIAKFPDSEMSNYLYNAHIDYYMKNNPAALPKLKNLNNNYNVKVFMPSRYYINSSNDVLDYLDKEFAQWKNAGGDAAKLPPVVDFSAAKSEWYDMTAAHGQGAMSAYSTQYYNGLVAFSAMDIPTVKWSLRHEMTHTNDLKHGMNIPEKYNLDEIMPKKTVNINGREVRVPDLENCKYVEEFQNAGVKNIRYAYNNTKEFIACAAQGDMTKYSPEFKQVLIDFGMPEWMFKIQNVN